MMLKGLRVVECSQVLSAPYAGAILRDLGADVIKVEKPPRGDEARSMGAAFRDDAAMNFTDVNRGKTSIVIDVRSDAGRTRLLGLLADADVFIHNFRPGDAERYRLDGPTLTGLFPRLVYCEIGAFGHVGPKRLLPGYEPLLQAYSGLVAMNGTPDAPPARIPASLVDQGTGMWTVIAALAALQRRHLTGRGSIVNTSLLETAIGWVAPRLHEWINQGRRSERYGTGHPNLVPYQAFEASDGLLMICGGNDRLFAGVCRALGHPEWMDDERFATNRQRLLNRTRVVDAMTAVLRTATRAHWTQRLQAEGVPVSPVQELDEVAVDEQVRALDILRPVPGADFVLAGLPMSFDGERPGPSGPAPKLDSGTGWRDSA